MDTRDGGDHMNYTGSQKVSGYIGKYFLDTGMFESRKDDEAFKAWDDAMVNFKKTIEKM